VRTVSVVVPVYNNAETLVELTERILAVLDGTDAGGEVVLVDDGSRDDSWMLIAKLAAQDERVIGLRLSRNFGQHPALNAAFERASGDVIAMMDADLQDRPEELPRLLDALVDDVDVVFTTWHSADGAVRERVTSRWFHQLFARLSGTQSQPRNLGTYRAFTRRYLESVLAYPERGAVYGPLMAQLGYAAAYIEVERHAAQGRRSSYTFRRRLSLALSSLLSYSDLPHRAVTWFGATLSALSVVFLLALTVQYFVEGRRLASGLTLLLGITVLLFGFVLLSLGIIGAYVYRVFQEVLGRPRFHIARTVGRGLGDDR
jgi:polyisoprenyl-phosphate glycosyltransferase